jgi:glycosyltransferase involved in cell wall biosynthesis
MARLKDRTLVVMTSTYPRWPEDKVSNFVEVFVNHIRGYVKRVEVIAPQYKGAKRQERPQTDVRITRFRYTWPHHFQNLAYGEFEKTIGYPFKVFIYTFAETWTTLLVSIKSRPVILNPRWLIPQGFVGVLLKPLLRCPVIVTVHGADVFTLNGWCMVKIKRFVLKHADAIVVNSSATLAVCRELYPRDDYIICPTGADTNIFKKLERYGQNPKRFEVLFVGRVVEQKGVMYLCQAMRLLNQSGSSARLTLIGDGDAMPKIREFIKHHNLESVIEIKGWVQQKDLPPYYAQADVFVGPSIEDDNGWKEGFGTVFAEASAMGLPIIATDTGGISDVIKDGVNGLLVPQKNAQAIASTISQLEANPKLLKSLGEKGPGFIEKNYSINVTTNKYRKIFGGLILVLFGALILISSASS